MRKLIFNAANLYPTGVKASFMLPTMLKYPIAVKNSGKSEEARRHAELQTLLVNDPFVKPAELSALKMKTLVIVGTKDLIKPSHTKIIVSNIPNAKLVKVEGGHGIAAENPDVFNKEVGRFLKEA